MHTQDFLAQMTEKKNYCSWTGTQASNWPDNAHDRAEKFKLLIFILLYT